jgi:DNA repair exonuclease SbcCD ATPase subunit
MDQLDLLDKMKKGLSDAGAKAKDMVETTRLSNQIGQKQREIERLYNKIGQVAFKSFQDQALSDIEASIKDLSQEIVQKQQEITELERNITEIRSTDDVPEAQSPENKSDEDLNQKVCSACGQVVTPETKACPTCDNKLENRDEYLGRMETQLGEWGAELDKLRDMADKAAADTKQSYCDEIEALHAKQASMQVKLQELKTSGDDAWGDLKEGLDHSWSQVRDSFSKAAARFKYTG